MISTVKRVSVTTALLTILAVTFGCDSGSDVTSSVTDTGDSTSGGVTGETGAGGGSDETDTSGEGVESAPEVVPEGSGVDPDVDPDTDNDQETVDAAEFEAVYSVRFVAIWSEQTHPINFPSNPHFSPLTGAVHNEQAVIWESGQNATDGIEEMAETGGTELLLAEIQFVIDEGRALSSIEGGGIPEAPGVTEVQFTVNRGYPLVTLVSMLAPSPDWFVGVNSLSMIDQNGDFLDSVTIDLNLYDSGTDGGLRYASPDEDIPRSPIGPVNSFPSDSDFLDGQPSVGSLIIAKMP